MRGGTGLRECVSDPARKPVDACMRGRLWGASAGVALHFRRQTAGKRLKAAICTSIDKSGRPNFSPGETPRGMMVSTE
jgi:hypothetical protein